MREGYRKDNPFALASLPKKLSIPKFLYAEELEELFEVSDGNTIRSKESSFVRVDVCDWDPCE